MCILALLVQAVKFIGFRDISLHQVYRKLQSPSMLLFTLSELINCSAVYAASTYNYNTAHTISFTTPNAFIGCCIDIVHCNGAYAGPDLVSCWLQQWLMQAVEFCCLL